MALIKPFWTYVTQYALYVTSEEYPWPQQVTSEYSSREDLADELELRAWQLRGVGRKLLKYKRGHYAIYDDITLEIWEL